MSRDFHELMHGGLIVSCQAFPGEPLYGAPTMARMAMAAQIGGAVGIRANGPDDIRAIRAVTELPVIGIYKRTYENSFVYITPTMTEVDEVVEAGADIVAVDATARRRPDGWATMDFLRAIRARHSVLVMGDVATLEEGMLAAGAGVDIVSTTLSGYTAQSDAHDGPDFNLLAQLVRALAVPVVAEGRISTPQECARAFAIGAFAVVVGSAITRPQDITRRFAEATPRGLGPRPGNDAGAPVIAQREVSVDTRAGVDGRTGR